jgi:hypothetical protein
MRERWFGSTGRRVPEVAIEGDPAVPVEEAVVLDPDDVAALREAHGAGRPVVVRASTTEGVLRALARPEVSSVIVPESARDLLALDLTELTYE